MSQRPCTFCVRFSLGGVEDVSERGDLADVLTGSISIDQFLCEQGISSGLNLLQRAFAGGSPIESDPPGLGSIAESVARIAESLRLLQEAAYA